MKVSILISCYNGQKDILPLLESINQLSPGNYTKEVIIRDDHSNTEKTEQYATKLLNFNKKESEFQFPNPGR